MKSILARCLAVLAILALLGGCAKEEYKDSAQKEYEAAKKRIDKGEYSAAAFDLQQFSSNHPYSRYAVQAELLRIFAAYKAGEFISAETQSLRFIDQHPRHPNVDYAKYMLAMCYYKQSGDAKHDPAQSKQTIDAFKRLINEHPESSYAKDGQSRLQSLYNRLAAHELHVGKFYYDRELYVAATNRFQEVVKHYQTTPSIEEALYYLAASYTRMGLKKDALQSAILLQHNYPESEWSKKVKELR